MKKISIIIPMYNVQDTLHNSLDSLLDQLNDDIELVLIDDGSTDNTKEKALSYKSKIKNFNYFYKENGGVSSARNYGLKVATGKYIIFLDADDFYMDNTIKILLEYINNYSFDVLCFGSAKVDKNYNSLGNISNIEEDRLYSIVKKEEVIKDFLNYRYTNRVQALVTNKLYKKGIIDKNNIEFSEQLWIGEDFVFNIEYFSHANNILEISNILYNYYQSDNSLMRRRYDKKNIFNVQRYKPVLREVFRKHNINLSYDYIERFYISKFFGVVDNESKSGKFLHGLKNVKKYCQDVNKNMSMQKMTKKEKIYYALVKTRFWYFVYILVYLKNKGFNDK